MGAPRHPCYFTYTDPRLDPSRACVSWPTLSGGGKQRPVASRADVGRHDFFPAMDARHSTALLIPSLCAQVSEANPRDPSPECAGGLKPHGGVTCGEMPYTKRRALQCVSRITWYLYACVCRK